MVPCGALIVTAPRGEQPRILLGCRAGSLSRGLCRCRCLCLLLGSWLSLTRMGCHPAGGIGLRGESLLVAFFREQGSLQLGEGLGAAVVVIGFQLLSELADGGGEHLGLDAQLPERDGSLNGAGRPGGLRESWGERSDGGGENGHGVVNGDEGSKNEAADAPQAPRGSGENGGGTSITPTGTGERQKQRRSCCTRDAVPAPAGGDALLGPDEITATSGNNDDRAMGQRRRRREAK
jgi:hypothetical protein